jgi:hypothetical protein
MGHMLATKRLQVPLKVMTNCNMCQIFCIYSTEIFLFLTTNTCTCSNPVCNFHNSWLIALHWLLAVMEILILCTWGDILRNKFLQLSNQQNSHRIYSHPKSPVDIHLFCNIKIIRLMQWTAACNWNSRFLRNAKDLNAMLSPLMFTEFLTSSLIICMLGFQLILVSFW